MKIAVVAANGRSGRCFVEAALAAGHEIRGGVYQSTFDLSHPHLSIIQCDATQQTDVENLITGCDVVVSFIGHVKKSPPRVQTQSIQVIVTAMKQKGIKRIVSLTGTGVRFPGDTIPFIDRIMNFVITVIDPDRVNDGIAHAEVLKASELEWTILRVLKLQNARPTEFVPKAHGVTKLFVGREEVAKAALQVIEDHSFVREAPILSKP